MTLFGYDIIIRIVGFLTKWTNERVTSENGP